MSKMTSINGEIIRWAREQSNVGIQQVAKRVQKDVSVVYAWERGEDFPTYGQLEKLADCLKKPLAIFFLPIPPELPDLKASYRTLPEFVFDSLSHHVIRVMNRVRALQLNLYELHDGVNPARELLIEQRTCRDIRVMAKEIREFMGITLEQQQQQASTRDALEMWRDCLWEHGIYVFKDSFSDNSISGFCLYDEVFPVICLNNSMSFTRQIFTLFHELFHLVSGTSGIDKLSDDYFRYLSEEQLDVEAACNAFAAEFLVPDLEFNKELDNVAQITEEFAEDMARKYHVSREVIMRKLLNRNLISQTLYENRRQTYIEEAIRAQHRKSESNGGNPYYTRISYLGRGYLNLVFSKYERAQIDVFQLADYTRTRIEHLGKLRAHWQR